MKPDAHRRRFHTRPCSCYPSTGMHVKELVIPEHIESASAKQVLAWSLETFQPRIGLCTSFAAEGVVLIDMLTKLTNRVRVFTLDTGRLMPETYAVIEAIRERYDLEIEVFFPRTEAVEAMTREEGVNLFYRSVEARKRCCAVRKVEPLERALAGLDAWIAGLRRDQAETRTDGAKGGDRRGPWGHRQDQSARRLDLGRGLVLYPRPRHPVQRAPRPGVSEHRLRAVHAGGGAGRGPAGRALVVGGRSRRDGVRPAPRSTAGIGARRDRELGVGVRMAFTLLRGLTWSAGRAVEAASESIVRLLDDPCRGPATLAERRAVALLAREGAVPLRRLVERVARDLYRDELRHGGSTAEIGFAGSALFRADAERVIADAAGSLWMIDRHHD